MKRLAFVAVAALALAACSENPTAPTDGPQFNKGVSSPNTAVGAQFQIATEGYEYTVTWTTVCDETGCSGLPSNNGNTGALGNDKCVEGALYKRRNETSEWNTSPTGVVPHPNCSDNVVLPGSTITVSFSEVANYVLATGKNIQLNFSSLCSTDEVTLLQSCLARYVHYNKSQNATAGYGIIYGTGSDNSAWMIDLGAFAEVGNASLLARSITVGAVELDGLGRTGNATFTW